MHEKARSDYFLRRLFLVAAFAIKFEAEACCAPFFRKHPGTCCERRVVAHMLVVSAIKLYTPVRLVILIEGCDFAFHRLFLWRSDIACARVSARDGSPPEDE